MGMLYVMVCIISLPNVFRFLFWSDWGEYPKIERSGMDGSNRKVKSETPLLPVQLIFGNSLID